MTQPSRKKLGNRIAPVRFLFFLLVLAISAPVMMTWLETRYALIAAFDAAALCFLLSSIPLVAHSGTASMRAHAAENDANRILLLLTTTLLTFVVLVTIASLLRDRGTLTVGGAAIVIATLALAWLFANSVFAFHYAHLYYASEQDNDRRGLEFPGHHAPDYWDFFYFSFTLGMTFQTSDVTVSGRHMRRIVLFHSIAAFIFNIGVLAFVINTLGGD